MLLWVKCHFSKTQIYAGTSTNPSDIILYEAPNAITALTLYEKHNPDVIITDIQMPKLNGLEFI